MRGVGASPFAPLLAAVRRLWFVFVLIAALMGVLALWKGAEWRSSEPEEVGRGPAGSVVQIADRAHGENGLSVLGRGSPSGESLRCSSPGGGSVTVFPVYHFPAADHDGSTWHLLGRTGEATAAGVFCPAGNGIEEIAIVWDRAGQARTMTFAFIGGAVFFTLLAGAYFVIGRVTRAP